MKLATALRLGRVSNLPTVTTNVLAAIALSGGRTSWLAIAAICGGMSLLYVAGMFLNDAFDRTIDAIERPDRPIPSGEVSAAEVFAAGFLLLAFGVLAVTGAAIATSAGWPPIASATVLAGLIVFYNVHHKRNPFAPVVMGLCRVGVYTTAALAIGAPLAPPLLLGCGALLGYLIGLTFVARQENLFRLTTFWPLALLAIPFMMISPISNGPFVGLAYVFFLFWTLRCLRLVVTGQIRPAVTGLIAGISLLDALFISRLGDLPLLAAAFAAFFLTTILQRRIAGT